MFGRSNKLRFQAAEYKSSDRLLKRRFGRETSFRWLCGEDSQETALFTLTRSPPIQKCRAQRRKGAEDIFAQAASALALDHVVRVDVNDPLHVIHVLDHRFRTMDHLLKRVALNGSQQHVITIQPAKLF